MFFADVDYLLLKAQEEPEEADSGQGETIVKEVHSD